MPTYEYECTRCGHKFDMLQSITARPKKRPDEPCEGCGERAPIRRLIGTGGAVLFKGSGFYETDYRSESYKKAAKAEKDGQGGGAKESSAAEGKTEGKKDASKDGKKVAAGNSRDASAKSTGKPSTSAA
jgi:putative FmdB family regulatory protein